MEDKNFDNIKNKNEIKIIYHNKQNQNEINIFGSLFVENNRNKCKIIMGGREFDLQTRCFCKNVPQFEIKLKGVLKIVNMADCKSLISLPDISKLNTSNVIDMSYMFDNCESLILLPDISSWNTSNVSDINHMFSGCKSLLSLPDISKWDTANVKKMNDVFSFCSSLISLPDISK